MMNQCFIEQPVTVRIMQFVTDVCSECYKSFEEGEESFYDTQSCRYLCRECADRICQEMLERERELYANENEEIEYSQPTLF